MITEKKEIILVYPNIFENEVEAAVNIRKEIINLMDKNFIIPTDSVKDLTKKMVIQNSIKQYEGFPDQLNVISEVNLSFFKEI